MDKIVIEIPGKAVGKGRPRFRNTGKFVQTYTPGKTVEYENLVRLAWMNSGAAKMDGDIAVEILAYFPIPKSVSKKKQAELMDSPYPHKPDVDNICKAILDSLNGIAFDDDSQVTYLTIYKAYSDTPRTIVTFFPSGEDIITEGGNV